MTDHELLLKRCQENINTTRKHTLKRKVMDLVVDIDKLTRNGSYQPPNATVSVSAPSFFRSPVNLQALIPFISPPAPFFQLNNNS